MDPILNFPASPGIPLFPVSPERANRQTQPYREDASFDPRETLATSPSRNHYDANQQYFLPTSLHSPLLSSMVAASGVGHHQHARSPSDVQGKVAQFNGLAKEAAARRKENEAALKRAVLGREEAEGESRRLREENERLRREAEEWRAKEKRSSGKMVGLQEELLQVKQTHAHAQNVFEKEVRRARKEAFKSSSSLVQLQDELKNTRNKLTLMREERDAEVRAKEVAEQAMHNAGLQLAASQDKVESHRQRIEIVESERDALKMVVEAEDLAKVAAAGAIALPQTHDNFDETDISEIAGDQFTLETRRDSLKENVDPKQLSAVPTAMSDSMIELQDELRHEKRMRLRAEEDVHFLKMECQFGICSCRMAEKQGGAFVHDQSFAVASPDVTEFPTQALDISPTTMTSVVMPPTRSDEDMESLAQAMAILPTSSTISMIPAVAPALPRSPPLERQMAAPSQMRQSHQHNDSIALNDTIPTPSTPRLQNFQLQAPQTIASFRAPRALTTPQRTQPAMNETADVAPATIDREAALEQIRLRRGRAKSLADKLSLSPVKNGGAVTGIGRREISAPMHRPR